MARKKTAPEKTTAEKLRAVLDSKRPGWTESEVADWAGVPRNAIWRITSGTVKNPGVNTIRKILAAVGADLCDFEKA